MPAPTLVSGTTLGTHSYSGGNPNTLTIPWPSGHQADDIGILILTNARSSFLFLPYDQASMDALQAGWTYLGSGIANSRDHSYATHNQSIFWKRATSGSMPSVTKTTTSPTRTTDCAGTIVAVRGCPTGMSPVYTTFLAGISGTLAEQSNGGEGWNYYTILKFDVMGVAYNTNTLRNTALLALFTGNAHDKGPDTFTELDNSFSGIGSITLVQGPYPTNTAQAHIGFTNTLQASTASLQAHRVDSPSYSSEMCAMSVVSLLGSVQSSSFSASGSSTATMFGVRARVSSFSATGSPVVSNPGNVDRPSSFSAAGVAAVSNPGGSKRASAFSSAGVAVADMVGHALFRSPFNAAGVATAQMVGAGNNASSFSSIGSSSANMIGNSTATSSFNSEGTSLAVMFSPSVVASAFNSTGTSTAAMFSPTITITTLIDGSGGAGLATVIDYSLCDFAQVILSAGVGTYSIEHVNLIPGKWITVTLVNQGASGSLIWNNGDAPVDWSPALAPDFPANGETLDLEFFVRRDRSVIRGRRAFA